MDIMWGIIYGLGLSIALWVAPVIAGIISHRIWLIYVVLGVWVPFSGDYWGIQNGYVNISIAISIVIGFRLFKINDRYARTEAMSEAPEWAARAQVTYIGFAIISSIVKLFL